ncbi:MAG: hypothetical protein ACKVQC_06670 [Elusimicrobiota bacterium]
MGIDVIKLNEDAGELAKDIDFKKLVNPQYHIYDVHDPKMSIWSMTVEARQALFPWWSYKTDIDGDIKRLSDYWNITHSQSLFDAIFLSMLKKIGGSNLFVIFPGSLKDLAWRNLKESDRQTFLKGQGCVYYLEGSYSGKLSINWVPFWQPQSIVKDPTFGSLWRLFVANRSEDDTNGISFFSLPDMKKLPEVVNLLIKEDSQRSQHLTELVDWFGMYTSPISNDKYGTCAVTYTSNPASLLIFKELQQEFSQILKNIQTLLLKDPTPETVIRFVSRQLAV